MPPGPPGPSSSGGSKRGLIIGGIAVAVVLLIGVVAVTAWALSGDDEGDTSADDPDTSVSEESEETSEEPTEESEVPTDEPTETGSSTAPPPDATASDSAGGDVAFTYPDQFRGLALDPAESQKKAKRSEYRSLGTYGDYPDMLMFQWFPDSTIAAGDYDVIQHADGQRPPDEVGSGVCYEGTMDSLVCVVDVAGGSLMLSSNPEIGTFEQLMKVLEEMADIIG